MRMSKGAGGWMGVPFVRAGSRFSSMWHVHVFSGVAGCPDSPLTTLAYVLLLCSPLVGCSCFCLFRPPFLSVPLFFALPTLTTQRKKMLEMKLLTSVGDREWCVSRIHECVSFKLSSDRSFGDQTWCTQIMTYTRKTHPELL